MTLWACLVVHFGGKNHAPRGAHGGRKGEKRPLTLRARVSPAKKAKTTKTAGKSIKRRTSDPPMCHVCEKPILPSEKDRCAECRGFATIHKDCLVHKSTACKARFCSEACKNAHIAIARDADELKTK
eukprot:jgi/Bigna1/70865/fgenesh1_pg.13_\